MRKFGLVFAFLVLTNITTAEASVIIGDMPIFPPPGGENTRLLVFAIPPFDFNVDGPDNGLSSYNAKTKTLTVDNVANPVNYKSVTLKVLVKKGSTLPQVPKDMFDAEKWPSLSSVGTIEMTGVSITAIGGDRPTFYMSWTINTQPKSETISFATYPTLADITGFTVVTSCFPLPVPEPSTWAMSLAGFGGLGFAALRRRKSRPYVSASAQTTGKR